LVGHDLSNDLIIGGLNLILNRQKLAAYIGREQIKSERECLTELYPISSQKLQHATYSLSLGRVLEWDEKREQEESENCPDQPPRTYDKAQEVLHRWATIWLLASLAEVTQCAAKSHIPCSFERIYSASL